MLNGWLCRADDRQERGKTEGKSDVRKWQCVYVLKIVNWQETPY